MMVSKSIVLTSKKKLKNWEKNKGSVKSLAQLCVTAYMFKKRKAYPSG